MCCCFGWEQRDSTNAVGVGCAKSTGSAVLHFNTSRPKRAARSWRWRPPDLAFLDRRLFVSDCHQCQAIGICRNGPIVDIAANQL